MAMKRDATVVVDPVARIPALVQLGRVMASWSQGAPWPGHTSGLTEAEYDAMDQVVHRAHAHSGWNTEANVRHAFSAWSNALRADAIVAWVSEYPELATAPANIRTVGLVLAGNIPLVGLHDVLCVWLSGHHACVKTSSQEPELIPALFGVLDRLVPGTTQQVAFVTGKWEAVDAVIATGSNNTARYFEHYFEHLPRIVRKSRVSVAVLDGTESADELAALGEDIFRYFGLGCRNVAKLYVPQHFVLDRLFEALFQWNDIANHNKYGNNYDYTRAIWLLDRVVFLDNGFVLLREDKALASPMGTVFYERYTDRSTVDVQLSEQAGSIQCIIGHGHLPFGTSQSPALGDYADGVDTLKFLLELR